MFSSFFRFDGFAFAHAEETVAIARDGKIVHGADLAHASLVRDAVDDERLALDGLELLLGPVEILQEAFLAGVLFFLRGQTAGLAHHAVVDAGQIGHDD